MGKLAIDHHLAINTIPLFKKEYFPLLSFETLKKKDECYLTAIQRCTMARIVSQIFLLRKEKRNFVLPSTLRKVIFKSELGYNDEEWNGIWNSTNVANITGDPTKSMVYKVNSSVIYEITCKTGEGDPFTIKGHLKRVNECKI